MAISKAGSLPFRTLLMDTYFTQEVFPILGPVFEALAKERPQKGRVTAWLKAFLESQATTEKEADGEGTTGRDAMEELARMSSAKGGPLSKQLEVAKAPPASAATTAAPEAVAASAAEATTAGDAKAGLTPATEAALVVVEGPGGKKEVVEMDTAATEQGVNFESRLLMPETFTLTQSFHGVVDKFSICYSRGGAGGLGQAAVAMLRRSLGSGRLELCHGAGP